MFTWELGKRDKVRLLDEKREVAYSKMLCSMKFDYGARGLGRLAAVRSVHSHWAYRRHKFDKYSDSHLLSCY